VKIHPIRTGTVRVKESQRVGRGHGTMRQVNILLHRSWTEPLPIYAWAIETDEGVVVVDTGETARTSEPGYVLVGIRTFDWPSGSLSRRIRRSALSSFDWASDRTT
jgi:hypothetical protein